MQSLTSFILTYCTRQRGGKGGRRGTETGRGKTKMEEV